MEGEPHEPEEALRGKVLLFMHASELGKGSPTHHTFLLQRVFSFVDFVFGLNDLTPLELRPLFISQTFQVKKWT